MSSLKRGLLVEISLSIHPNHEEWIKEHGYTCQVVRIVMPSIIESLDNELEIEREVVPEVGENVMNYEHELKIWKQNGIVYSKINSYSTWGFWPFEQELEFVMNQLNTYTQNPNWIERFMDPLGLELDLKPNAMITSVPRHDAQHASFSDAIAKEVARFDLYPYVSPMSG